jgi:hypothetical protein
MRPRFPTTASGALAILLLSGCNAAPPEPPLPPFKPVATLAELMHGVVDPAADVLWASVGSVVSKDGVEDFFPRTEEEWIPIENAAVVLMESGNLLMIGDRAKDQGEWMTMSRGLVDAGKAALTAAQSRNPDEIFRVGGDVYAACEGCHQRYWTEGARPSFEPVPADAETAGTEPPAR